MGQYHYLLNLDKKQVIHPHQIGNGFKLCEQIAGSYSTATVLVMLLASSSKNGGRGGGDFRAQHPLVGSWAGDRIAFLGDYAEAGDISGFDAPLIYREVTAACNPSGADNPPEGWKQWANISAQVREMMMAEFNIRYVGESWLEIVEKKCKQPVRQIEARPKGLNTCLPIYSRPKTGRRKNGN